LRDVRVVARYGASDGYVAYTWRYDEPRQRLRLRLTGTWEQAHIRLLLPADGRNTLSRSLRINGQPAPVYKKKIGSGQYIALDVEGGNAEIELNWTTEKSLP
jgi:hypothetical protein